MRLSDGEGRAPPDEERWRRLEALFQAALERPPSEREAFVRRAAGGEAALASEVLGLLAAADGAEGRILGAVGGTLDLAEAEVEPGRRIGPYRLLREIGRGGIATVYLAERDDREYRMEVAVKVVRRALLSPELLERLRRERQILASLDHPGIARLLDGGTTREGVPFYVMERVDGEPIDRYCEALGLGLTGRLDLVRRVCAAVQHAHRNLVIHRDLKPSNILVTPQGDPKLLDFGIAKVLDPELIPTDRTVTVEGLRPLTPDCASPEQVQGGAITTATDVYALGVLLYRLLTGHRPYDFPSRRFRDVERVVCEVAPVPPSARVRSAGGGPVPPRRLAGDLDAVVLMALRKEPERRYGSAEALADDLGRYLQGRPVAARRETVGYRLGKFLRRHRRAAAALLAGLVLLVVLGAVHTVRLAEERDRARREAATTARVAEFLVDLFEVSDPAHGRGRTVTARSLLEAGAERAGAQLAEEPLIEATMVDAMGRAYRNLGLYDEASPLLERALQLRRRHLGESHPQVAESLNQLGHLRYDQGDYRRAEPLLRDALALRRELFGRSHPTVAESLNDLAALYRVRGELDRSEVLFRQALAVRRQRLGPTHPQVAHALRNLATVLQERGELNAAERAYGQALTIQRLRLGDDDPAVTVTLINLASLLQARGELARARSLYGEALVRQRRLLGPHHPDIAWTLNNLGALDRQAGELDAAEARYREALSILRELGDGGNRALAASVALNLADLLSLERGEARAAVALYREALAKRRQIFPAGHWKLVRPLERIGILLLEGGAPGQAEAPLAEAVAIRRRLYPASNLQLAVARGALGACLGARGAHREAGRLLADSLAVLESRLGAGDPRTRQVRRWLDGLGG